MKTIYKYKLEVTDEQKVIMPEGSKILSVGNQGSNICIWAVIDTTMANVNRLIRMHGTGHPLDMLVERGKFIGTVVIDVLVWHVFDLGVV